MLRVELSICSNVDILVKSKIDYIFSCYEIVVIVRIQIHSNQGWLELRAAGGGGADHMTNYFRPLDQLFDQLLQLDQLNWPLDDVDIIGQTVKVGQITEISLKKKIIIRNMQ